jgi:hypothetical protein
MRKSRSTILCLLMLSLTLHSAMDSIPKNTLVEQTSKLDSDALNHTDLWISVELNHWFAVNPMAWDTDGTEIDPQFRICLSDTESHHGCVFTQIWQDSVELSDSWAHTFDISDEATSFDLSIQCFDNDDVSDEWNNGDDVCDMNPEQNLTEYTFEGDVLNNSAIQITANGSGDNQSVLSTNSSWTVLIHRYRDYDGDGVFENRDRCPMSSDGTFVDRFGCSWVDEDYDDDGILNGNDPCPDFAQYRCGNTLSEYQLGYRETTLDAFGDTNFMAPTTGRHNQHFLFDTGSWQCGSAAGGYGAYREWDVIAMEDSCTQFDVQDKMAWSSNYEVFAHADIQRTGDWSTQNYVLRVPWGNYTPDAYCCRENSNGNYIPSIIHVEVSGKGDFVAWVEQHKFAEHIYGYHHYAWYNGSAPILLLNSTTTGAPYEESVYWLFSISHDGRYIVMHKGEGNQLQRTLIYDLVNLQIKSEFYCNSVDLARRSNTLGCTDGQNLRLINIENSETITEIDFNYEPTGIQFSPSDNHLLIPQHDTNTVEILNLNTGNIQTILAPEKESFDSPVIYATTFYRTDEVIFLYIQYEKSGIPCCASTEDRHEVHLYGIDHDNDGVISALDLCINSLHPDSVDENGCGDDERDSDNDGVTDIDDDCEQTLAGEIVDLDGCSLHQLDTDFDGVNDAADLCPNTPFGAGVGITGCSVSQIDSDQDGIFDYEDSCPRTQTGEEVNLSGCSDSQTDTDGDGVVDSLDLCADSEIQGVVDADGCTYLQMDDDSDGIPNVADLCPNTDNTTVASEDGCGDGEEPTQSDADKDGLVDVWDFCYETPAEEVADLRGCSPSQLDDDGDGISNAADECPEFSDKDRLLPNGCEDTSLILGLSPNAFLMTVMVLMLGGYLSFHYIRYRRGI